MDFELGGMFDFGGNENQEADQLASPAEQSGSAWGWLRGKAEETAAGAADMAGGLFLRSQLAGLVEGPEVFDLDLIEEAPGAVPVQLTQAGRKWLLIGAGALVAFWIMGRR